MDTSYYKKYEPIFGKWHIVRELGEGSFGKVFEIEHRDLSGTYSSALKVITIPRNKTELAQVASENTGPDGVTKYFRSIVDGITKEFNIMSQLKGESTIVSYEDHEVKEHTDGIGWDIFIRMELLTPLLQYTANYPLSRNDIIRLGIDICSALELCRKNAIIHRDIKPENIFVSKNGRFKLGDFGIAKNIDKTTSELTKTGTYTYMAPEVYKGEAYGASVDIYSLGIVLYNYTNNGRSPFISATQSSVLPAEKTEALLRRMKGEALPAPANADEALSRVILKACAYLPRDRYLTPTDMRRDLEALLDGRSIGVSSLDKTVGIFGNKSTATTEAPAEKPSPSDVTEPDSKTASYCAEPLPSVSAAETVGIFHGGGNFVITPEPKTVKDHVEPQRNAPEKRVQPQPAPNVRNVPPPPPPKVASTKKSSSLTPFLCIAIVLLIAVGVAGYALISSGSSGDLIHNGSTSPSGNYAGSDDPTSAPNANAVELHASEYLGDPSGLTRIWFKSATASSQIYSEGILYSAENAIDNSTSTSWQEDADDDGEGEYLTLFFDGDTSIKYVSILPGYAKSTSAYYRNNRPKDILIEFSDGRSCTYTLPDGMSYATLALNDTVTTSYIRITILSVYKGETWDDTAITEVIAYR